MRANVCDDELLHHFARKNLHESQAVGGLRIHFSPCANGFYVRSFHRTKDIFSMHDRFETSTEWCVHCSTNVDWYSQVKWFAERNWSRYKWIWHVFSPHFVHTVHADQLSRIVTKKWWICREIHQKNQWMDNFYMWQLAYESAPHGRTQTTAAPLSTDVILLKSKISRTKTKNLCKMFTITFSMCKNTVENESFRFVWSILVCFFFSLLFHFVHFSYFHLVSVLHLIHSNVYFA